MRVSSCWFEVDDLLLFVVMDIGRDGNPQVDGVFGEIRLFLDIYLVEIVAVSARCPSTSYSLVLKTLSLVLTEFKDKFTEPNCLYGIEIIFNYLFSPRVIN